MSHTNHRNRTNRLTNKAISVASDETPLLSEADSINSRSTSRLSRTGEGADSLFLCLVLDNPFDPNEDPQLPIDSSLFEGYELFKHIYVGEGNHNNPKNTATSPVTEPTKDVENGLQVDHSNSNPQNSAVDSEILPEHLRAGLKDDDFLLEPESSTSMVIESLDPHRPHDHIYVPNKYQKIIELVLRLQKRELDVFPEDILVEADFSECGNANYFKGWKIDRDKVLSSPNQDDLYIKIHASRKVLCKFAEKSSIPLLTHDFSFGGGAAMPYSEALEHELTRSVRKYFRTFEPNCQEYEGDHLAKGFDIHPNHKLRLLVRFLREQWRFGGCGLQLNEMKRKKILIKNYFPLHNREFIVAKQLDTWASLYPTDIWRTLIEDKTVDLSNYFGEQVGLYFQWLREYIIVIVLLGIIGLFLGTSTQVFGHTALTNASFAIVCVCWAFFWNLHWNRKESLFAIDNCQEEQIDQEPVRDEFRVSHMEVIQCSDIYRMTFKFPLSLQITADCSFINLYYSNAKRLVTRYMFSYPIVFILTALMITVLTLINYWRFKNPDDQNISYAASVLTVVAGQIFGVLFETIVGFLNWAENNRTDADEDNERIVKSFFFYFFSFYYSLFVICLWPLDGPSYLRLQQLQSQMLIICIAKPIIATASGVAVPYVMCSLRKRYDISGGVCGTIASLICCQSIAQMMEKRNIDPDNEGVKMWIEAQLQPYDSTANDYLRVTLQFGYMAMFAATYPWAAPAALLYNIIDRRADAVRLLHYCQRPMAKPSASIGPWKKIFMVITFFAVITNCYLICVLSPVYDKIGLEDKVNDAGFKWMSFIIVQYGLVLIAFGMAAVIPPVPVNSRKLKLKRFLLTNPSIRQRFYDRNKAETLAAMQEEAVQQAETGSGSVARGSIATTPKISPSASHIGGDSVCLPSHSGLR